MNIRLIQYLMFASLLLGLVSNTHAAKITYTATNLSDTTMGEDLWQYSYSVSDHTFTADTGFTIYFDHGLYDLLDPLPTITNTDWDVITWDPDLSLPDDGAYDAYALVDNASLTDLFVINFVWSGGSVGPASQYFEVYDGISWGVLDDGFTSVEVSTVPAPSALLLFGSGLSAGLVGSGIRRKSKKQSLEAGKNLEDEIRSIK